MRGPLAAAMIDSAPEDMTDDGRGRATADRVTAIIGLGSNVEPERHLGEAVRALRAAAALDVLAVSSAWATPAVGPAGQPPFLNAAVLVATTLPAPVLRSEVLRPIESALGRVRTEDRYAPRTIDLDLVTYGTGRLHIDGREIPDPDLAFQAFLAVPAAEVAPGWLHPVTGVPLARLAADLLSRLPEYERPRRLAISLEG